VVIRDFTFETFTPRRAQVILSSQNVNNRIVRWDRVKLYADAMKNGTWLPTGDTIRFDVEDRLIDGQHRLLACIEANVPFTSLVVRKLPVDAFKVIDSGLPRKTSDVVRATGINNAKTVSSSVAMLLAWRNDCLRDSTKRNRLVTRAKIIGFIGDHVDLVEDAVSKARQRASKNWRINATAISALAIELYLAKRRELFDEFYDTLVSGENLCSGDARLTLIKWAGQAPRTTYVGSDHLWACVRAWNAWAQGEPLKQIKPWTGNMPKLYIPAR
jgi:hypothetical protein